MRVLICCALSLSLMSAVNCSRDRSSNPAFQENAAKALPEKDEFQVTGCLTGNPAANQYIVTANDNALTSLTSRAGDGDLETYAYQLIGGDNLVSMIGKEVVAKGTIEGGVTKVKVDKTETSTVPAPNDATAAIKTTEQAEIKVRPLRVASITPTGSACK